MSPEDAYSILEAIAEIHGCGDKLKMATLGEEEKTAEKTAQEINTESTERAANFSFGKCSIPVGAKIEYCENPYITATVADDRNVEYNGETMSLTALAKLLSGKNIQLQVRDFLSIMVSSSMISGIGWECALYRGLLQAFII